MHISKIELTNIRCLGKAIFELEDENGNCRGCVILGDNGTGKTTILRAVAMCLCGKSSAAGLMDELEGEWIARGAQKGSIRLDLKSQKNGKKYYIEIDFSRESEDEVVVNSQKIGPTEEEFPWDEMFVCGYGASRGVYGSENYTSYSAIDAVYTLFNPDAVLQNPELMLRRIKDAYEAESSFKKILSWIDAILMLKKGSVQLGMGGLIVSGPWGNSMPIGALADGHHTTVTMICDLLGFALLHDQEVFKKELIGMVMIDEVEQHLHPKWQRKIVGLLKEVFPKIQFIMTTHSPLVAGNAGRLFDEATESELFYVGYKDQGIHVSKIEEKLGELDCNQILFSEAFGHIFNINQDVDVMLKKASELAAKDKRTEGEDAQYQQVKNKLKELMFPEGRTLIERKVEREYYTELRKKLKEFNDILEGRDLK